MAARRSYASDRRQSGGYRSMQYGSRQAYMYGNIVTKPEYEPRRRKSSAKPKKKVSRQVQKNRNRALHMNAAYVIFLAVAATVGQLLCVTMYATVGIDSKIQTCHLALRKNWRI